MKWTTKTDDKATRAEIQVGEDCAHINRYHDGWTQIGIDIADFYIRPGEPGDADRVGEALVRLLPSLRAQVDAAIAEALAVAPEPQEAVAVKFVCGICGLDECDGHAFPMPAPGLSAQEAVPVADAASLTPAESAVSDVCPEHGIHPRGLPCFMCQHTR